ncbi:ABC transporter substrate-binding protein [Lacisediminihabitans profunda]|uniref:ABC transporter substrate-binding protein n=1 Tax=Lacisediminihabitans profunda TaxID=2594790 RepID=A0A5C8UP32_9MICO|nr:ABC transporter substrate-binding protein [Lacisediminihabitans profunda]TXN30003.1 ABC transporter substrate-binding protein [Lacisediminihabitans profunda]
MNSTSATRRWASAIALASGAALVLSACSAAGPTATSAQLTDTGAAIANVTVALPGSLSNLYPGTEAGILNYYIASISQEGLVSVDANGKIQPGLAKSWKQPDPLTYVYTLRSDAKFQDGNPVTAADVVFSIEQAEDATVSPGVSFSLAGVASATATGEHEVTVKLTAPDAAFITTLSTAGALFVTEKSFWEANKGKVGTSAALIMGTGPYKVTSFSPDSSVTLERVNTWWGTLPKTKTITVKFIPDENTRFLAAKKGEIDVAFNVPLAETRQWEALKNMRVEYANDLSYVGLNFDTRIAPFDDPKVREAIAYSVDKAATVKSLLRGHGEVATAMMTPESLSKAYSTTEAHAKLAAIPQYTFDLKKAKAAIAASTHPSGFTAEFVYPATGPQLGTAAQALAANLAKIGITLNVKEVPIEQWLATIGDGKHGVGYMWYFSTTGDPAEVPTYLLGAGNISGYSNAKVTSLLTQASATQDPAARVALLIKAETQQAKDVINVPLWWGQSATAFSSTLGIKKVSAFAFLSSWPTTLYRGK